MIRIQTVILITGVLTAFTGASAQDSFAGRLNEAALRLTHEQVEYDPGYYSLDYPNGDVPAGLGVCSDVVVRAYRMLGIDLQKEVHEDMSDHFELYPGIWGLEKPDPNIDHRRVPNLMTFFERHGTVKGITDDPGDYLPGDIVCWNLGGGITHIGIVVDRRSQKWEGFQVVHNIGAGQVLEDCLFDFRIIGHYSYTEQ
jgi:uncharacterized protein YijF (DUF1287 family)